MLKNTMFSIFITLLAILGVKKINEETGWDAQNSTTRYKAQKEQEDNWKRKELIREQRKHAERQIDEIKKNRRDKKMNETSNKESLDNFFSYSNRKNHRLSTKEICLSEEIQERLAPVILDYLDDKTAIIDALEWILMIIVNDQKSNIDTYKYMCEGNYRKKIDLDDSTLMIYDLNHYLCPGERIDDDESIHGGYMCQECAERMGVLGSIENITKWYVRKCDFCSRHTNLCKTTDWNWSEFNKKSKKTLK